MSIWILTNLFFCNAQSSLNHSPVFDLVTTTPHLSLYLKSANIFLSNIFHHWPRQLTWSWSSLEDKWQTLPHLPRQRTSQTWLPQNCLRWSVTPLACLCPAPDTVVSSSCVDQALMMRLSLMLTQVTSLLQMIYASCNNNCFSNNILMKMNHCRNSSDATSQLCRILFSRLTCKQ